MFMPYFREIKPEGWLRRQLEIQARGLSGNLDKIWPDVRDSAWIGGNREGWERVPYWLDGFIPLGFLLEDQDLIARAEYYISSIIERQQEDGWICPCKEEERAGYDPWAVLLIGKVLALYCEFKDDEKVYGALYKAMKNLYDLLSAGKIRLHRWGEFRWFEGVIPLLYLKAHGCNEDWIKALGEILREQGADYASFKDRWVRPLNKWTFETHVVNIAMMCKYEGLICELLGEEMTGKAEELWQHLIRYNGTAVGTVTGDECLSGLFNNQGTELCAVVEMMYCFEWLYRISGDPVWADRLEKVAFNAMPATFTDDMWAHQYDQQVNQIACIRFPGKSHFRTNGKEAHLFGLEPNYGCCTANMHQGWPKLALHCMQKTDRGIILANLLPASLTTVWNEKPLSIRVDTLYPFRMNAKITVEAPEGADFCLSIRIPGWAKDVKMNGESVSLEKGCIHLEKAWQGKETLEISFKDMPHFVSRPHDLKAVEYGALVFSLPIQAEYKMYEYEDEQALRRFPYCDYELYPLSPWNYGFAAEEAEIKENEVASIPFSSQQPPLTLKAKLAPVEWEYQDGYETVAAPSPLSHKAIGDEKEMELIPYGCAKLRMTEMPLIEK